MKCAVTFPYLSLSIQAQVEAYCSGKVPLPPPPPTLPSGGVNSTSSGAVVASSKDGGSCIPTSNRKKRRNHNKNKSKGVSVTIGGYCGRCDQGSDPRFPVCSQCSNAGYAEFNNNNNNTGNTNQWTPPTTGAGPSESTLTNFVSILCYQHVDYRYHLNE